MNQRIKATFEIDRQLWRLFVGYARISHSTTASALLRKYIQNSVKENMKELRK